MIDPEDHRAHLQAKLNGETAKIPWRELQRFFAQGRAIRVAAGLDLIEVATSFTQDRAERVQSWTDSGKIDAVSDDLARAWFEADALVWAVVVRPWVLVQPVETH